ncbi:DUF4785 domain-containing protein [Myxococcus sp. RHSTA-1-4]|uniref:DUF4785 family immunoglobulin-like domain-containing protein n=1 Tax=Myxococcus sp. RHSTA-1-4 TaxID=2874601 RepID=UPI001CBB9E3C|nr:DUF4785 domain-containing protein [Myxococcus sp. RHSTA-1-4]MBZ4416126.1 DUF4785 family protein [Myxococcus sp. RHSTA-1-4]
MNFPHRFVRSAGLALAVAILGFTPESAMAGDMQRASGASLVAGDVAPGRLFGRDVREGIGPGRVSVSNPSSPKLPLAEPLAPETRRSKSTVLHVPPGSVPTQLSLPIDTPDEAWVMFIPRGDNAKAGEEALREVTMLDPQGRRADLKAERAANAQLGVDASKLKSQGITRPITMLRLDREMGRGRYKVEVGRKAAELGMAVEVRVPTSSIELSLTASAMQLFPGDDGYVTVGLQSDAKVDHVRYEAVLYTPRFEKDRVVPVVKVGNEHRALVSRVMNEKDEPGAWVLEVRAVGSAGGQDFDRLGQTSFGFAVPTARFDSVGRARLVRDAGGKVTALEVDVVLESAAVDRYEVTGTLVATDAKGVERPVAEAQVTDQLGAGTHTLTLRFEAGHAGLSKLDGTYALKDLRLFSLGTNTLYHRLAQGLGVRFPAVRASELAAAEVTPAIENLLREGEFNLVP